MEMRITIPSLIPSNVTINLAMSALATVNEKRPAPKNLIMGISDCDPIQNLSRGKQQDHRGEVLGEEA